MVIRINKKYHQGLFKLVNPLKYRGNRKNIVFRSSWEMGFMSKLDLDKRVVEWSSEETVVQYRDPVSGRRRRYFPDFLVKKLDEDGQIRTYMVEIKPFSQTKIPKRGKTKSDRRFMTEAFEYGRNVAKWKAAEAYCLKHGYVWTILTERNLSTWGNLSPRNR